jgi:hypothetical protein
MGEGASRVVEVQDAAATAISGECLKNRRRIKVAEGFLPNRGRRRGSK